MDTTTNIGPIEERDIIYCPDTGLVEYSSKGDCDCDGPGGSSVMDPDWQPTTSLQWLNPRTGKLEYIDSCVVPGVVVPPAICRKTRLQVLGSMAWVSFDGGPWIAAVVYDIGPSHKIGEFSVALHKKAGSGGSPSSVPEGIRWRTRIFTGVAANIPCTDGITRQFGLKSFG